MLARVSSTATAAPGASQERPGCRRRGAWSSSTAMVTTIRATPDRPAGDVPGVCGVCRPAVVGRPSRRRTRRRRPAAGSRADREREDSGQHRGAAVLLRSPPVAADAVDAVGAALDLRHRGGHRHQREAAGRTTGRSRRPAPTVAVPRSAAAIASAPPGPGETAATVAASTRAGRSSSRSATNPVRASRNGMTASEACRASARD